MPWKLRVFSESTVPKSWIFLKDGFPYSGEYGLIEIDNLFYNYISLVGNMRLWWRRCSYRAHLTSFIE